MDSLDIGNSNVKIDFLGNIVRRFLPILIVGLSKYVKNTIIFVLVLVFSDVEELIQS